MHFVRSAHTEAPLSVFASFLPCAVFILVLQDSVARAEVRLPGIFSDGVVLQRSIEIPVWGWADQGEDVVVELGPDRVHCVADDNGKWKVKLPPLQVTQRGEPYELMVRGKNTIKVKNVLIGEVWICSGQSNMEMPLGTIGSSWGQGVYDSELEVAGARYPEIRLFTVWKKNALLPCQDCLGRWSECDPGTAISFPAPAYFFSRRLYKELNIPIGVIHNAYAGVKIEAYMAEELLTKTQASENTVSNRKASQSSRIEDEVYHRRLNEWQSRVACDRSVGGNLGWAERDYGDSDWNGFDLAALAEFKKLHDLRPPVYYRKAIEIPIYWGGRDLELQLVDLTSDEIVAFNGTVLSLLSKDNVALRYRVPAAVVVPGNNLIAVRSARSDLANELARNAKQLSVRLSTGPDADPIQLDGKWTSATELRNAAVPQRPEPPRETYPPPDTTVYNGMVAPLIPFGIRGIIWYQGESNVDRPASYSRAFTALIRDWRARWGQGDFPFYFVQLANCTARQEGLAATFREAQSMALALPHTGMVVTIDISNAAEGHPRDKLDVGERLARLALAKDYGREITPNGPLYRSMSAERDSIRLHFDCVGSALTIRGGATGAFQVSGSDKHFYDATAVVEGNTVVVRSERVTRPTAARYAWENAVQRACLYNNDGLPAAPFRTDK
jgi:sialate O-acetylesterase